jgi:hypothetical protein
MVEWFDRMIHPIVDYAHFTYIILHSDYEYDYSSVEEKNNIEIIRIPRLGKWNDDIIKELL